MLASTNKRERERGWGIFFFFAFFKYWGDPSSDDPSWFNNQKSVREKKENKMVLKKAKKMGRCYAIFFRYLLVLS